MWKFLGSSPPLSKIQAIIRQLWGRRDPVDVVPLENGVFLFKFENSQTCT